MHAVKYSKLNFVLFPFFMADRSWKSIIHCVILEYYTQRLKKRINDTEMSNFLKVMLMYALSNWSRIILNKILHQWGVAWRWITCDTAEVLWKPRIALMQALSSSVWLSLVSLIFELRPVDWSVKPSNTMVSTPVIGSFGSVGRCQMLLVKINHHLHKAC